MRPSVTRLCALAALCFCIALPANAQDAEPLGDEFIFFVEGVNPAIPTVGANVTTDPDDAENKELQFSGGNFANPSLSYPKEVGVDISQNQADRDTVFFRLRVGPGATGVGDARANLSLMFLDSESLNNNGMSDDDDIAFRLIWPIPAEYFDGTARDIALALPPPTVAALDSAKKDLFVDGSPRPADQQYDELSKLWQYQGGYNPDGAAFVTFGDGRFREFDYENVFSFGFFWDQPSGPGGNVYVDDFYIGSVNTDLSAATGVGNAYDGTISTSTTEETVEVSFTPQSGASGYRLYAVTGDGVDVADAENATLLSIYSGDTGLSLSYPLRSPHPNVPNPSVTFAVTSVNENGIENTTATYASATLDDAPEMGYAFGMTSGEVDALFGAFENGEIDVSGFALETRTPFLLGKDDGTIDGPAIDTDADFKAEIYLGWAPDPDFPEDTIVMVYGDVTDDVIFFAPDDGNGLPNTAEPFLFDRIAMFFGTYQVPFPIGSANGSLFGGEDFALDFQPVVDGDGNVTTVATGNLVPDLFGAPLYEEKADGSGWRVLAAFLVNETQIEDGDVRAAFERPEANEIGYFPVIFGFDEQDGPNVNFDNRNNIVHSERPNVNFVNPGWYQSPLQWEATAWAGSAVGVANENVTDAEFAFGLSAPYPNPATGSATVRFTLEAAGPATLDVFDLLGRRVAQLQNSESLAAGPHATTLDATGLSAGVYMVRLSAGDRTDVKQFVLLK